MSYLAIGEEIYDLFKFDENMYISRSRQNIFIEQYDNLDIMLKNLNKRISKIEYLDDDFINLLNRNISITNHSNLIEKVRNYISCSNQMSEESKFENTKEEQEDDEYD